MKKIAVIFPLLAALFLLGCTSENSAGMAGAQAAKTGGIGPNTEDQAAQADAGTESRKADSTISIPLSEISGTAKFFEYGSGDRTIRFFAVKGSDGSIKTAFDACDVCYYAKKGYSQNGSDMVCNNCGNRYPIDSLGTANKAGGGCWPGYLPNRAEGDSIVLEKADLERGVDRFA